MSEWQPIETAPNDGQEVLVFDPNWGTAAVAFREEATGFPWAIVGGKDDSRPLEPTHWMPLPAPPE